MRLSTPTRRLALMLVTSAAIQIPWAASAQSTTVLISKPAFQPGETGVLHLAASNNLDQPLDFYAGVRLPDQETVFLVVGTGQARLTTLKELSTWTPLVSGLGPSGAVELPVVSYVFTGEEPKGCYLPFSALVKPGSIQDGEAHPGDVLSLAATHFAFGSQFITDPGVAAADQALLRRAAGAATCFFARHGLGTLESAKVTAHSSPELLIPPYSEHLQELGVPADQALVRSQDFWRGGATGVAEPGHIFWNTSRGLWFEGIAHEYFHLLQYQRAVVGPRGRDDEILNIGPRWLIEGSAVLMQLLVAADSGLFDYSQARLSRIGIAKTTNAQLSSMGSWTGMLAAGVNAAYAVGFLAAELLTNQAGLPVLNTFWAAIGEGASWEQAFSVAFDRDVATFYEQFEAYRSTL